MAQLPPSISDPRVGGAYAALSPAQRARLSLALAGRGGGATSRVPVLPRAGREDFPVSFGQQRLWFLDQVWPGSVAYVVPAALRLTGTLDAAVLGAALTRLVARHEVLRTTFPATDGRPVARIGPAMPVPLAVLDLCDLPEPERVAAVERARHEAAGYEFDLAAGPLLHATLLRTGPADQVLLLTLHHIVTDGWSMAVLVGELADLYRAELSGQPARLPEQVVQYVDFAGWQRDWLRGGELDRQLGYWREALRGAPSVALPTDRPRAAAGLPAPAASPPVAGPLAGAAMPVSWPAGVVDELSVLARDGRATLFMALLAGLSVTLARAAGQPEVVIGTPVAGRPLPELESLVGFFVNTLPLRVRLAGDPSFRELLARVRQVCLDGLAHQDAPYEKVVDVLRPDRGREPLVRVMLALRNVPQPMPRLPGLSLQVLPAPVVQAKFELTWELEPDGSGGLRGRLEYASGLFDPATARDLHEALTELLTAAASSPDVPVSQLPPARLGPPGWALVLARATAAAEDAGGAPGAQQPPGQRRPVPPRDALERLLALVWTEVLGVPQVGALDDFFELGGHSLLATQAVSRIQEALGLPVPLDGALSATSVRDFAGYLRALGEAAGIDVDGRAEVAGIDVDGRAEGPAVAVGEPAPGTGSIAVRRLERGRYAPGAPGGPVTPRPADGRAGR